MKTMFLSRPALAVPFLALLALASPPVGAQTQQDWGDAPTNYLTLAVHNGARHNFSVDVHLGPAVDAESNGQPNANANGDDTTPPGAVDDEDGVTFNSALVPGQAATITVNVFGPAGFLNAWVDFNGNLSFAQAGEQIFTNRSLASGNNTISFNVPSTAVAGTTYARFRWTLQQFTGGFAGTAPIGEVEDYLVTISLMDFGDAPTNYPTLLAANGARHPIVAGLFMGVRVDGETNGQPNATATGDDINPATADDEDGVTFLNPLIAGQVCTGQVVVAVPPGPTQTVGFLYGWIDFNGDGDWADAGEQVYNTITLVSGTHLLPFTVPATAVPGNTMARFRWATTQGLSFNGAAPNGEVEDYQVTVGQMLDYGDAPDRPYPTLLANNGARHVLSQGFNLGPAVDLEANGQPNAMATGDDIAPAGARDDEDGVVLSTLVAGQSATATVTLSSATGEQGRLDAWVDFDLNGVWEEDTGEHIFNNTVLNLGVNTLTFAVPASVPNSNTFARFRLSRQGGLRPTGLAPDGEVEDYQVTMQRPTLDFGDAPQPYPTLLGNNGARHTVLPGLHLGTNVDVEPDGLPSVAANGDDAAPAAGPDDEDGVVFTSAMVAGQTATVRVTVTFVGAAANARLYAWVDFNNNGSWADAGEQIFNGQVVNNGVNNLTFNVPSSAVGGQTYARFRVTTATVLFPDGLAPNGEVEDYQVSVTAALDYGDAPDPYPTLLSQNGARHPASRTFCLGQFVDEESNGQPNAFAQGDDTNPPAPANDDEDGVQLSALHPGQSASATVFLTEFSGAGGRLDAWLDFNQDGDWADPGEQIFVSVPLVPGNNTLTFSVPASAAQGSTFARFRLSRQGGLSFTGLAQDGEVEDYSPRITPGTPDDCDVGCKGTDFWLAFPANYAPDPDNPLRLRVCAVGPAGTKVNVSYPASGFSTDVTIPATMAVNVIVPNAADLGDTIDVVEDKAVRVTASAPISVYAESHADYTTDGYLALPTPTLGRAYMVQSFSNLFNEAFDLKGSQFAIVACETNTRVVIRPSTEAAGHAAGVLYQINLDAGQTYQLRTTNGMTDLSGTIIVADKPIGVFGSHRCANIPNTNVWFCDYIVEQLLPVTTFGQNFVTFPLATRDGDTFRCQAAFDDTTISFNGAVVATIDQGESYQALRLAGTHITADRPISVMQYANSGDFDTPINMNADPFMVIVPPTVMFSTNHMVCTAPVGFGDHYLNVVVPTAAVGSVRIDGAIMAPLAPYVAIPGSGYSGAQYSVSAGPHQVTASQPVSVTIYGWAEYDSYGWPGCLNFGDTTPPTLVCSETNATITLQPGSTSVCSAQVPDFRPKVQATDNCSSANGLRIEQEPAPGTPIGGGMHTVFVIATDQRGNEARCPIKLTVLDPSDPRIFCPSNLIVNCTSPEGAIVTYVVPARTACNTPLPVTCNPPPGTLFKPGNTLVTCSATNDFGKLVTCEFIVTVRCLTGQPTRAGGLTISWTGGGVLEATDRIGNRWVPLPNATSPFPVQATGQQQQFFRVRYD